MNQDLPAIAENSAGFLQAIGVLVKNFPTKTALCECRVPAPCVRIDVASS
jgi:hypothetical protein